MPSPRQILLSFEWQSHPGYFIYDATKSAGPRYPKFRYTEFDGSARYSVFNIKTLREAVQEHIKSSRINYCASQGNRSCQKPLWFRWPRQHPLDIFGADPRFACSSSILRRYLTVLVYLECFRQELYSVKTKSYYQSYIRWRKMPRVSWW